MFFWPPVGQFSIFLFITDFLRISLLEISHMLLKEFSAES